jgi:hypothetical protein
MLTFVICGNFINFIFCYQNLVISILIFLLTLFQKQLLKILKWIDIK